jgi:exodeoxyribonuclease V alpha subunit
MSTTPTLPELRRILTDPELFSSMDSHFAMFIGRLAQKHNSEVALAAALVSRTTGEGNICLDLAEYADKPLDLDEQKTGIKSFICPMLSDWKDQLLQSGVVHQLEGDAPLVLDKSNLLYLRRYWEYENFIIRFLLQRSNGAHKGLNHSRLGKDLKKLFPHFPEGEIDWQLIAAIAATTNSFCVISGGPGTGKTSTVAKILALLIGQHNDPRELRILLGAPTGKAASRLQQAITATGLLKDKPDYIQTTTLHRMLGYIPDSPYFRHHAENPLSADIVIIDEASMVDLPLMAKLMQAVPESARLILLGDRHQLASVQPGSVLGDICSTEIMSNFSNEFSQLLSELTCNSSSLTVLSKPRTVSSSLQDSFVELVHSYRFSAGSGISRLSMAVKEGDGDGALDIMQTAGDDSITWSEIPAQAELVQKLQSCPDVSQFAFMQQNEQPDSYFAQLESFCVLCALRRGPFGMQRINSILEQLIEQQILGGHKKQFSGLPDKNKTHLAIRPIMVTQNDYNLQLFNGDVGILMSDPYNQQSNRAIFREENGFLRDISTALLPDHETVFAMTVHKCQGSEFDRVLLILPDQDSPLLTRELIYTAITRAKKKVEIWGRAEIFTSGVKRQIKRTSGLTEALRAETR